jgi:hypothetical protein
MSNDCNESGMAGLGTAHGSAAGVESGMCEQCHGQGWYMDGPTDDPQQRQCEACYGTGIVEQAKPQPNNVLNNKEGGK